MENQIKMAKGRGLGRRQGCRRIYGGKVSLLQKPAFSILTRHDTKWSARSPIVLAWLQEDLTQKWSRALKAPFLPVLPRKAAMFITWLNTQLAGGSSPAKLEKDVALAVGCSNR